MLGFFGITLFVTVIHAATAEWNILAPKPIMFGCGGGNYSHTLNTISEDTATGNFSGTGTYDTNSSYTWTITGNVTGNNITFTIVYTSTNAGYTLNGVGTIGSGGTISGTVDNNCQTFSMPAGAAVAIPKTYSYSFDTKDNGMPQVLWAVDHFKSTVTITPTGAGCYDVVRADGGTFDGITNAKSPGGDGTTYVGAGTTGTVTGGITLNICGTLNPNPDTSWEDVSIGTYANYAEKYYHRFFSSISSYTYGDWGWTFSTCFNGTWIDNEETEAAWPSATVMGDIKGTYIPCPQEQCKNDGWRNFLNAGFKNQGQCVSSFANGTLKMFGAPDTLYYNGPTNSYPLYGTGSFVYAWNPITGIVIGGYYNEVVPPYFGTTYYNQIAKGTVSTAGDVTLEFTRTKPGDYGFIGGGKLVGNDFTGWLDGSPWSYLFTAKGYVK